MIKVDCENMNFPFRDIKEKDVNEKFTLLKCIKFNDTLCLSRKYNIISDYYFQKHRLSVRKLSSFSPVEAWKKKEEREKIIGICKRHKNGNITNADIRRTLKLYYGCVGQFRPDVAVYVYKKFNSKNVLDFSAGWGDRCIAAISQGIKYTGIDTNIDLMVPYSKMINDFDKNNYANIIFEPAENVVPKLKSEFDLVFTSPPYYNIEKYNNMPEYKTYEEFINTFFIPVVKASWNKLCKGGYMALNIPLNMYESLMSRTNLGEISGEIHVPIHNRPNTTESRKEIIYYWKK